MHSYSCHIKNRYLISHASNPYRQMPQDKWLLSVGKVYAHRISWQALLWCSWYWCDEEFSLSLTVIHIVREDIVMVAVFLIRFFATYIIYYKQVLLHNLPVMSIHFSCQAYCYYSMEIILHDTWQHLHADSGLSSTAVTHTEQPHTFVVGKAICHLIIFRQPGIAVPHEILQSCIQYILCVWQSDEQSLGLQIYIALGITAHTSPQIYHAVFL